MGEKARKVSDLLLEKMVLGELSPDEKAKILELLKLEEGGMKRLDAMKESNEEILRMYPPVRMGKEIRRRISSEQSTQKAAESLWKRWGLVYAAPFVLTAILLIVALPNWPIDPASNGNHFDDERIILKGHPHLVIYKKSARQPSAEALQLKDGAMAGEGDILQISYIPGDQAYGIILSIDGRGSITLHLPEDPADGAALLRNEKTYLAHAYELDDAPDFERFFFITSDETMNIGQIRDAAGKLAAKPDHGRKGDMELPGGYKQNAILINKGQRNEL